MIDQSLIKAIPGQERQIMSKQFIINYFRRIGYKIDAMQPIAFLEVKSIKDNEVASSKIAHKRVGRNNMSPDTKEKLYSAVSTSYDTKLAVEFRI